MNNGYGEVGSPVGGLFAPKAVREGDQASGLRTLAAQQGIKPPAPDVDKARLWDELVASLRSEIDAAFIRGHIFPNERAAVIRRMEMLERMEKAEEAATFERVREDMGGRA